MVVGETGVLELERATCRSECDHEQQCQDPHGSRHTGTGRLCLAREQAPQEPDEHARQEPSEVALPGDPRDGEGEHGVDPEQDQQLAVQRGTGAGVPDTPRAHQPHTEQAEDGAGGADQQRQLLTEEVRRGPPCRRSRQVEDRERDRTDLPLEFGSEHIEGPHVEEEVGGAAVEEGGGQHTPPFAGSYEPVGLGGVLFDEIPRPRHGRLGQRGQEPGRGEDHHGDGDQTERHRGRTIGELPGRHLAGRRSSTFVALLTGRRVDGALRAHRPTAGRAGEQGLAVRMAIADGSDLHTGPR